MSYGRNLEDPANRVDLARFAGVSARQLERWFRRYLARSPAGFYMEIRLDKARHLLQQTEMTVLEVAVACGFTSTSHFSKCYRERFKKTPREERGPLERSFGLPKAADNLVAAE